MSNKMEITPKQAKFILDAIEWAVNDGMSPPDYEQAQIIMKLNIMTIKENK